MRKMVALTCNFELSLPSDLGDDHRERDLVLAEPRHIANDLFEVIHSLCEAFFAHRGWDGGLDLALGSADALLVNLNVGCH